MEEFLEIINKEKFNKEKRKFKNKKGSVIPLLQAAQKIYSFVPKFIIKDIADITNIPSSRIYGIVTFYKQFRLKPVGKHIIRICEGTACHVNNAKSIIDTIKSKLNIKENETTKDGLFTLQSVACIGCCSLAPVIMIDNETYGMLTSDKVNKILDQYIEENEVS